MVIGSNINAFGKHLQAINIYLHILRLSCYDADWWKIVLAQCLLLELTLF